MTHNLTKLPHVKDNKSHVKHILLYMCQICFTIFWHMACQIRLKWSHQRIIVKHILHMCQMWLCAGARFIVQGTVRPGDALSWGRIATQIRGHTVTGTHRSWTDRQGTHTELLLTFFIWIFTSCYTKMCHRAFREKPIELRSLQIFPVSCWKEKFSTGVLIQRRNGVSSRVIPL
jgi:hypothetical protein